MNENHLPEQVGVPKRVELACMGTIDLLDIHMMHGYIMAMVANDNLGRDVTPKTVCCIIRAERKSQILDT